MKRVVCSSCHKRGTKEKLWVTTQQNRHPLENCSITKLFFLPKRNSFSFDLQLNNWTFTHINHLWRTVNTSQWTALQFRVTINYKYKRWICETISKLVTIFFRYEKLSLKFFKFIICNPCWSLSLPWMTKTDFLFSISIQYQA